MLATRRGGKRREHFSQRLFHRFAVFLRVTVDRGRRDGAPHYLIVLRIHEIDDERPRDVAVDRDCARLCPIGTVASADLEGLFPRAVVGDLEIGLEVVLKDVVDAELAVDVAHDELVGVLGDIVMRACHPGIGFVVGEVRRSLPLDAHRLRGRR